VDRRGGGAARDEEVAMSAHAAAHPRPRQYRSRVRRRLWYTLLLVEFVAVLVPSFYARATPKLYGVPFFYWYQFAWIIGSAILTAIVYKATTTPTARAAGIGSEHR
jgi:uncharacterized membrane protein